MKRPEEPVTRPTTPAPSTYSQIDVEHEPLEDIRSSFDRLEEEDGISPQYNHTDSLLDSFYSSDLYRAIQDRVGSSGSENNGYTSVWVDSPTQDSSKFSIYQFYHELVRIYNYLFHILIIFIVVIVFTYIHQPLQKPLFILCTFRILHRISRSLGHTLLASRRRSIWRTKPTRCSILHVRITRFCGYKCFRYV